VPGAARAFRIFVSSTFADLKVERNAPQERVLSCTHETHCSVSFFTTHASPSRTTR